VGENVVPDHLFEVRNVTLLMRLVIAGDGRLLHGEFLDLQGQQCGRFHNWDQILPVLRSCVAASSSETSGTQPPSP
jgi:hypothetical protein